jgi:hypothetical protein
MFFAEVIIHGEFSVFMAAFAGCSDCDASNERFNDETFLVVVAAGFDISIVFVKTF